MIYSFIVVLLLLVSCSEHPIAVEAPAITNKTKEELQDLYLEPMPQPLDILEDSVLSEFFLPFAPRTSSRASKGGFVVKSSECATLTCHRGGCEASYRPNGVRCGNKKTDVCDADDACDGNGNCVDLKSTALCREAVGECDPADYCDGIDNTCPDFKTSAGVKCGPPVDLENEPCDRKDQCDGQGNCVDLVFQSHKICEPGVEQECNPLDHCNGVDKTCPVTFAPAGKSCNTDATLDTCDLPDECDGDGTCVDLKTPAGTECEHAHGFCRPQAECDGTNSACISNFAPLGTPCGPTLEGECNELGLCEDGFQQVLDSCPNGTPPFVDNDNDTFSDDCDCNDNDPSIYLGTPCTAPDACFATICTQEGDDPPSCEQENFVDGTGCTNSTSSNACAEGGFCTSGTCVTEVAPSTTVCRASAGECDNTEFCDGTSTSCPPDSLLSAGTPCGNMQNNFCIAAQTCDGQSQDCAPDTTDIDGLVSNTSAGNCPTSTPTPICSEGLNYCMDKDLTDQTTNPKTVLIGEVGTSLPQYGTSISIHGDYAVVSEPNSDHFGTIFVYHFDSDTSAVPTLIATLYTPGRTADNNVVIEDFGRSVSLYNNRFAVGAPLADAYYDSNTSDSKCDMGDKNKSAGAVYVFRINGDNTISTEARLQGTNIGFPQDQQDNCQLETGEDDVLTSDSNFGYDVAISENYLVAGAPHDTSSTTGFAYIYTRNGDTWGAPQLIGSSLTDGQAQFGTSVAISPDENKIAFGAPFHDTDHDNNGNLQTYLRQGTLFYGPKSNITGENGGDRFGYDVSITNNLLLTGAPEYNDEGRIYLYSVLSDATLGDLTTFSPPDSNTSGQFFGATVSLDRSHNGHSFLVGSTQWEVSQGGGIGGSTYTYGYFSYYSVKQSLSSIVPSDFSLVSAQSGYEYNIFLDNGLIYSCQQDIELGNAVSNDSNRIAIGAVNYIDNTAGSCGFSSPDQANPIGAAAFQFFPY